MSAEFSNVYDDQARADSYARLEFPGTYYLAYRDLPAILGEHAQGTKALDFGWLAGRVTFRSWAGSRDTGVRVGGGVARSARSWRKFDAERGIH